MRGAPSAVLFVLLFLLHLSTIVVGKLLRVNEWYGLTLPQTKYATLKLSLFYSCDKTSIVVKTGTNLSTRLRLFFDGEILEKIDVDSPQVTNFPQNQRIIGGCREKERKWVTVNISSIADYFELYTDGQMFRRPKARRRNDYLEVGLPQETSCCIIKATLAADVEPVVVIEATTLPTSITSSSPSTIPSLPFTQRKKPLPTTASHHEYKLYSWTDVVNREWSMAFLIFAGITCALMAALIVFGLMSWGYLLTKPTDARTLYRVDTPTSVF